MATTAVISLGQSEVPRLRRTEKVRRVEMRARAKGQSFLHYLGVSLGVSFLVLVLGIAAAVIAIPAIVGGSAMTVLTQSMEPHFPPGTLMVIRPTPVEDIKVGDVMTYQMESGSPAVVSHRVISKTYVNGELTFMTQGDNNDAADPNPVAPVQIRGTLWYSFPLLGWVNNLLNGANHALVIGIAAGGLFLYSAVATISAARKTRRTKAAADAAAPAAGATSVAS
jgi:signal peptidase